MFLIQADGYGGGYIRIDQNPTRNVRFIARGNLKRRPRGQAGKMECFKEVDNESFTLLMGVLKRCRVADLSLKVCKNTRGYYALYLGSTTLCG